MNLLVVSDAEKAIHTLRQSVFPGQRVGPAVGCFVEPHALEAQGGAVAIAIVLVEQLVCRLRQVLGGGRRIEQHGLVAGDAAEEGDHGGILPPGEKGMVPGLDHVLLRDGLDRGKIHHHALVGGAGGGDHRAAQGDFDGVAVPVQVTALAAVVGDAVAGVEFQPAGDAHGAQIITSARAAEPDALLARFAIPLCRGFQFAIQAGSRFFQVLDQRKVVAAHLGQGYALDMHDAQQLAHRFGHAAAGLITRAAALGDADQRPELLLVEAAPATDFAGMIGIV